MLIGRPVSIAKNDWYYEVKEGIEVIHEVLVDNCYLKTDHIIIPWSKLEKSLERRNKR
jgi:hypothetical protein